MVPVFSDAAERLPVRDLQPLRIYMQWLPQAQFAGLIMAKEKGFFRANGLDVQFLWAEPGDRPLEAIKRKEAECSTGWLSAGLLQRAAGARLVNIMQLHQRSAALIIAHRDILTPQDLSGKIVQSWGSEFYFEVDLFLQRNGVLGAKVLPLSSSMAPFLTGLVSAIQGMEYNEYFTLVGRGIRPEELSVFKMADYGINIPGDGLYVHEDFLLSNRETVKALRKAVLQGWVYALTHENESLAAVIAYAHSKHMVTNLEHQRTMLAHMHELITHRVGPDPENWGTLNVEDFMRAKTIIEHAGYPLAELSYEQFFVLP